MKIHKVNVHGLHGFLEPSVTFDGDLAIVVGVNGAGKTSVLNLVAHLLRLNIYEVARISFSNVVISGVVEHDEFVLSVERAGESLRFRLEYRNESFAELGLVLPDVEDVDIDGRQSRYALDRIFRRIYDSIAGSPIAEFLRSNVRLSLVRLDRSLFAEDAEGGVAVDAPGVRRGEQLSDPIERVERVTRDRYNKYRVESKKNIDLLTREVVLQLFKTPKHMFSPSAKSSQKLSQGQIRGLKNRVFRLPYFRGYGDSESLVNEYFDLAMGAADEAKRSGKGKQSGELQDFLETLFKDFEFPRINGLVRAFDDFETADAAARAELDRFEGVLNSFLVESGKEVFFSEREASLRFRLKGSADESGRPIGQLSSGEKQIVTMLTYLAFLTGEESIFVVDEPELSLHLAWQMKLVDALLELRPAGSQLILATHSPEIVGLHRSAVVRLVPDYAPGVQ